MLPVARITVKASSRFKPHPDRLERPQLGRYEGRDINRGKHDPEQDIHCEQVRKRRDQEWLVLVD